MSMNSPRVGGFSNRLERALRWAAFQHRNQVRKGTATPYIQHPYGVALLLDRFELDETVVIAGLLHDVVEDTNATLDDLAQQFGPEVAGLVAHCSERKVDESGQKRPWADRKRDHCDAIANAPWQARAIVLADKLHNLISIRVDLEAGVDIWSRFNAGRAHVLEYHRAVIDACLTTEEPPLLQLAAMVRDQLAAVERCDAGQIHDRPPLAD